MKNSPTENRSRIGGAAHGQVLNNLMSSLVLLMGLFPSFAIGQPTSSPFVPRQEAEFFEQKVRPILNGRCVACHSCYDSPCQLNLQSRAGLERGALQKNVYDGSRLKPVQPTRLFEDGNDERTWREQGFNDVRGHSAEDSILLRMLRLAQKRITMPRQTVRDNLSCPRDLEQMTEIEKHHPENAMPYGLPGLTTDEVQTLTQWIDESSPREAPKQAETSSTSSPAISNVAGPQTETALARASTRPLGATKLSRDENKVVSAWEKFLNATDLKHRVVARYLFEHFFLAHFSIEPKCKRFFKLVRSQTACELGVNPVRARRANSDPGVKDWSYCFYLDPATPMLKNHIPYSMTQTKLAWLKQNFFSNHWQATSFPSFEESVATNPFVAFREIPVSAKYRFLLEDSRYHIMTFIKGPVCNGSIAVNVIQEQFYVFFMSPQTDLMTRDSDFFLRSANLMNLPAGFDAQPGIFRFPGQYAQLIKLRNQYRELHAEKMNRFFPNGVAAGDIWDGEKTNPNSLLTVLRHDDNAFVSFGARGDVPKTVFLLDYSLFERLVYNLVVNFDVFGDVKHQALTRLYMDLLRMESEDNYLELLPKQDRLPLKDSWYRGLLTGLKLDALKENDLGAIPNAIKLSAHSSRAANGSESSSLVYSLLDHRELLRKLIFEHLSPAARGADDVLNWKNLRTLGKSADRSDEVLRKITSIRSGETVPFARYFPELTLLFVSSDRFDNAGSPATTSAVRHREPRTIYSLVHNQEHENISWMFGESSRKSPVEDTLLASRSVLGGYPNLFLTVKEKNLPQFVLDIAKIDTQDDYRNFIKNYAVERTRSDFWFYYDIFNESLLESGSVEGARLDLSRYEL